MSHKNPIKFLDSYTREDKDIFFGREKDTDRLYQKINQSKVVLLYGLSGTGKTSLIHCGLENRYDEDQRLFIYIRKGNNIHASIHNAISSYASSLIHPRADSVQALETLYFDYLKPITIIFDQFEELFISGAYDEIEQFIDEIATIIQSNLKVKIIFSLREEYLAHMDEFEARIPSIYDHRHRLEKMRRSTLEEVISKISAKGEVKLESDQIPSLIIDNISDRKGNVELPYLQVYLDKLTRLGGNGDQIVFTKKLVDMAGELEDVLADFLEEQINRIADLTGDKEAVNNTLKQLITPDGTKRPMAFNDLNLSGNLSSDKLKKILNELELSRLVKLDDGIYELSHDSLAKKIAEKRTAEEIQLIEVHKFIKNAYLTYRQTDTVLDQKQLKFIQAFLPKLDLSDEEKILIKVSMQKARKRKLTIWLLGIAGVITILSLGFYWQYLNYQSLKKDADDQMVREEYRDARTNYLRALDVYVPLKTGAEKGLDNCNKKLKLEPVFDSLVKSGDSLFYLGINNYDAAFQIYQAASSLNFSKKKIERVLSDKSSYAISKYLELAEKEEKENHTDIAISHMTRAFQLNVRRTEVVVDFNELITNSTTGSLDSALISIKAKSAHLIQPLGSLVNIADDGQANSEKYKLMKEKIN